MPKAYSDTELLRRYLRGDIDARQEAELERRAEHDPDLRTALEGIQSAPEHDHMASVHRMLAQARTGESPEPIEARWRPSRYWWAAAAGLLLLVALVFQFAPFTPTSPEIAQRDAAPAPPPPDIVAEAPPITEQLVEVARDVPPLAPRPVPPPPAPTSSNPAPAPRAQKAAVVAEEAAVEALTEAEVPRFLGDTAGELTTENRSRVAVTRQQAPYLDGRVLDAFGEPIVGADVRLPGQPFGITTDSLGTFRLPLDAVTTQITVIAPGYETETVRLDRSREDLQINLESIATTGTAFLEQTGAVETLTLDEVTGELRRQRTTGLAQPSIGFRNLRRKIADERPADVPAAKVRVSFLVQPNGRLADFRFRGRAPEATRAYVEKQLREQADWSVGESSQPVRVHLRIKL